MYLYPIHFLLISQCFHMFGIISVIVDCVYRQFFSLTNNENFSDINNAFVGLSMLRDEKSRKVAEQILKYGYIEATPENLKTYMDGYTKLDDSELEAARQNYNNAISEITNIKSNADEILTTEQKSRISYLEQEARTLNKLIDKLENLAPTDAAAYSTVTGAEASINSLSSNVNGMTPIQVNTSISM